MFYEALPFFAHPSETLPIDRLFNLIIPFESQYRQSLVELFERGRDRDIELPLKLKDLAIAVRELDEFLYRNTDFVLTIRSGLFQIYDAIDILICCDQRAYTRDRSRFVHINQLEEYINLLRVAREYKGSLVSVTQVTTKTQFKDLIKNMINDSDLLVHSHTERHTWAFECWSHL